MDIEKVNVLFLEGVRIKNIAQAVGASESQIHNLIKSRRRIEPTKWPLRSLANKKQTERVDSYIAHFRVYECPDCILIFAVEQTYEDHSDVCCPVCWTEDINDVSSGAMKIVKA